MLKKDKYVKGFTLAEVLVTLALTSVAITLSYGTLTYIQQLYQGYKLQNKFINQVTDLKKRLDYEALTCDRITEESENRFEIRRDSSTIYLQILEKKLLVKKQDHCDTFNLEAKNIKKEYEKMKNPLWSNRLVKTLAFEAAFTKQQFSFYLNKEHDAALKLALDNEE